MTKDRFSLGIVGFGPRGQFALECFLDALIDKGTTYDASVIVFEATDQYGNGPVWSCDQTQSNWSNVTERVLDLPPRMQMDLRGTVIPEFPSYKTWAGLDFVSWPDDRVDTYPPRRAIGKYLSKRARTLLKPAIDSGLVHLVEQEVDQVVTAAGSVEITTKDDKRYSVQQALLTIGHQSTKLDDQLGSWGRTADGAEGLTLLSDPYPVEHIIAQCGNQFGQPVALRGFGLAAIDIIRAMAEQHGDFKRASGGRDALDYIPAKERAVHLVPFSLDGLPLGPKPLSPEVDSAFAPTAMQLETLDQSLRDPDRQKAATGRSFLLDALCPLIDTIFRSLEHPTCDPEDFDVQAVILAWVDNQTFDHCAITSVTQPTVDLMRDLVAMATGEAAISLDYCIGQVWRHCHPTIYSALSYSLLSNAALAEVIAVDESLKRYSFGPPTESIQQLIALASAGVLDLRFVKDPTIGADRTGWTLSNDRETLQTTMMVNTVLEPPNLAVVNSSLVEGMKEHEPLKQAFDDLGILTNEGGFIVSTASTTLPIAVLGRLAKGSVIGVDAILECFGERPKAWAAAAVDRLS